MLQAGTNKECEFNTVIDTCSSITSEVWYSFESAHIPGAHIGIIDGGQFSVPSKTPKSWDAAKFKVALVTAIAHVAIVSLA